MTATVKGEATPTGGAALVPRQLKDSAFLSKQILTYLGNKRTLLPYIGAEVARVKDSLGRARLTFFDAFAGSGIVSRYMKRHASLIVANDLERYSEVVNRCYLTNRTAVDMRELDDVFEAWRSYVRCHREPGFITRLYAPADDRAIRPGERVFYTHANAVTLDSARAALDKIVPAECFDLLMGPLLASASVHANTSGVFKGFYKNRDGVGTFGGAGRNALSRICGKIELEKPVLSDFDCESRVLRGDANEVVATLPEVDLAYFDPPYNQHPYGSNYFMLNLLAENREPTATSEVSGIPKDWNRSQYNRRAEAEDSFYKLLANTPAKYLLVSYNSEGFISQKNLLAFLKTLGTVRTTAVEYSVFKASRNLCNRSQKVTEFLFLVQRTNRTVRAHADRREESYRPRPRGRQGSIPAPDSHF